MPPEESKPVEPVVDEIDAKLKGKQPEVESDGEEEDDEPANEGDAAGAPAGSGKKKKSKKNKVKESAAKKALSGLTPQQMQELVALNPALAQEVAEASGSANPTPEQTADLLKNLNLQDIMTGLASGGKNVKEMGAYRFWQTQPVPRFDEEGKSFEEGPIKIQMVDQIAKEPPPMATGYEWVTMDLTNDEEIKEVYELLNGHYVEDDEAMFRFNYSPSFLRWCVGITPSSYRRIC